MNQQSGGANTCAHQRGPQVARRHYSRGPYDSGNVVALVILVSRFSVGASIGVSVKRLVISDNAPNAFQKRVD